MNAPSVSQQRDSDGADAIISIRGVGKAFAVNDKVIPIFADLSYDVPRGSFVSIIGPSGCGKSTLLRLVAGLEPVNAGSILFAGRVVAGPPKGMIYVFQQYAKSIFPWRTVLGNVEFGLRSQKRVSRAQARDQCRDMLRLVGLEGYEDYYPYQLSGGMQQRVVIARALICEPAVLLMDEPFSAVDAMTRAILQELILRIWSTIPITILFVTHDIEEAVFLSSHIIALGKAPSGLRREVVNPLPHPRDPIATLEAPDFVKLRQQLFADIFWQEKGRAP